MFGGAEFGVVGAYERLHGTAFCELDPAHPLNAGIVNLDKAPRNARGNVEYQSEFRILKPLDLARGNGWLVYDVPNRGNQPIMSRLNGAPEGGHPQQRRQRLPDAPRLHIGVELRGRATCRRATIVWSHAFPIIEGVTGMVREEFIAEATGLLGDGNIQEVSEDRFIGTLVYPVADPSGCDVDGARTRGRSARHAAWSGMASDRRHAMSRSRGRPCPGFDRGAIFEFIYRARDPIVMGIGFAAIRDIVSFLRHDGDSPLRSGIRHAAGFGISQSGRVLRDLTVSRLQPGPRGTAGVRRHFTSRRRLAPHLHQLAICTGRPLFASA